MDASKVIDKVIAKNRDWRTDTMTEVRRIIRATVPDVTEEVKWMGTPTWSKNGILCICNAFKDMVKITFYNGAMLHLDKLFNAELEGNKWRAIKLYEGDKVDAKSLEKLLHAAVALNASKPAPKPKKPAGKKTSAKKSAPKRTRR